METRASYVLVGAFTLLTILGAFGFVMWQVQQQLGLAYAYYDIQFDDAVLGLSEEAEVRFNGIRVGEVKRIWIKPDTPDKVWVRIRVERRDDIKIRQDAYASLEYQGVTGVSYINIQGGKPDADLLPVVSDPADGDPPVLASKRSSIQQMFAGVPSVLSEADKLLRDLQAILNPENRERIGGILEDVETMTGAVASRAEDLESFIANVNAISGEMRETAIGIRELTGDLKTLAASAQRTMDGDVPAITSEFRKLASNLNGIVEENEEAINTFANQGLAQVALFVTEARQLVASMDRIAQRFESDAPGLLFGTTTAPEIEPRASQ